MNSILQYILVYYSILKYIIVYANYYFGFMVYRANTELLPQKTGALTKLLTSSIPTLKPSFHCTRSVYNVSLPPVNCLPRSTANALQEY